MAYDNDDGRSGELEKYGLKVIRFKNNQILEDPENVTLQIQNFITSLTSPSPPGEGDQRG
ncbi:MAG TPA: DUF559 domain-containing protein [Bacteroidales bacterium]|nr:DUF559 domain-containing protein [Bacteroidales bacterium]